MRWLIACVLLSISPFASAEGRFYGEVQVAAGGVQHSDIDFFPVFGSISAGMFLVNNIGIELFADTGLASDKSDGFDMEIEQATGIAARFQSPAEQRDAWLYRTGLCQLHAGSGCACNQYLAGLFG